MIKLELKIPPLIVMLIIGAIMWLAAATLPSLTLPPLITNILAVITLVLGVGVSVAGVWSFNKVKTTVNPMTPSESSALVDSGIYKISRNPMYVGFLLFLIAWALFLSNLYSMISAWAFVLYMNRFQIAPEEKALLQLFGNDFEHYAEKVRRWL